MLILLLPTRVCFVTCQSLYRIASHRIILTEATLLLSLALVYPQEFCSPHSETWSERKGGEGITTYSGIAHHGYHFLIIFIPLFFFFFFLIREREKESERY